MYSQLSWAQGCAGATQLKTPYNDGTTHVIFEPLDFIAKLTALVIIRPGDLVLAKQLESLGLNVVENAHADEVMGLSLETVVSASIDAAGWIVVLVDMPWISPQTIATVAQAVEKDASLVQPVYQGRPGHPVGFNRKWGEQLQALKGDRGARGMLEKKSWIKQDTLGKEESKKVKKDNCPF